MSIAAPVIDIYTCFKAHPTPPVFMPLCTCGCLALVTNATKINHLKGKGKATLRTRVAAENEWLTQSTMKPSKKRSHSTSDQNYSRTRHKAAQVEVEGPGIILADADPMEFLPEPAFDQDADADPGDALPKPDAILFVHQRLKGIMEERWGNGVPTVRKHDTSLMGNLASVLCTYLSSLDYKPCQRTLHTRKRCAIKQIMSKSPALSRTFLMAVIIGPY